MHDSKEITKLGVNSFHFCQQQIPIDQIRPRGEPHLLPEYTLPMFPVNPEAHAGRKCV